MDGEWLWDYMVSITNSQVTRAPVKIVFKVVKCIELARLSNTILVYSVVLYEIVLPFKYLCVSAWTQVLNCFQYKVVCNLFDEWGQLFCFQVCVATNSIIYWFSLSCHFWCNICTSWHSRVVWTPLIVFYFEFGHFLRIISQRTENKSYLLTYCLQLR